MSEDPVPVSVESDWYAATLHQALDQQEVAVGLLLLAEEGVDHGTGGIIYRDQQRERRYPVPQPWVMAAVHLDQHALPWHSLAAYPVLWLAPAPRTAQPGVDQDARRVVLPMSMPSRSLSNSLRWVWLVPAYLV